MAVDARQLCKMFDGLKAGRAPWEGLWNDVVDYMRPSSQLFSSTTSPGQRRNKKIVDSTGRRALKKFASGLQGFITNPAERWFIITPEDSKLRKIPRVREWLQAVNNSMYSRLSNSKSRFYPQSHTLYMDIGAFGWGVMHFKTENGRLMFKSYPNSECYYRENNKHIVDTLFRKFTWTAQQVLDEFEKSKAMSEDTRQKLSEMAENKPDEKLNILHAVYPREQRIPGVMVATNKKYASVYSWLDQKALLDESGFDRFPFVVPRWEILSGDSYPQAPAFDAIDDVKMANAMKRTILRAGQKAVDPPLQGPDAGFITGVNLNPAAMNRYRAGSPDRIEPIVTGSRPDFGDRLLEKVQMDIEMAFFLDQLQDDKKAEMSATEFLGRDEQRLRQMAPQLGRMAAEYLDPILEGIFEEDLANGVYPPVPDELAGVNLKIMYVSPLARAQKMMQVVQFKRYIEDASGVMQLDPNAADRMDGDGMMDWLQEMHDAPNQTIRSEQEVQSVREQRAQQQQVQEALAAGESASKSAANLAKLPGGQGGATAQ